VELRESANGTKIARYGIAVDRRGQDKEADFFNIVAFNKAGEFAERFFRKGMRVLISGRIQTGSYTDKDGQKVNTFDIIADEQEFADGRGDALPEKKEEPKDNGFMDIPDNLDSDGLPFN
jgi:single-strand DNA-binding protein